MRFLTGELASQKAARSSEHPIDADHKRVMEQAVEDPLLAELLLDLRRDDGHFDTSGRVDDPSQGLIDESMIPTFDSV